jgi:hypothetical protein
MVGPSDKLVEWTVALTAAGPRIDRSAWPLGGSPTPTSETASVTRMGTTTVYDVTIPWTLPEIEGSRKFGCRLSLLVNDNDGAGRKGWVEWTPGIGKGKDASEYVPLTFAK